MTIRASKHFEGSIVMTVGTSIYFVVSTRHYVVALGRLVVEIKCFVVIKMSFVGVIRLFVMLSI
jgi:hypothetical protein